MPELDPYAVLGLRRTATAEDIGRAYRDLVRRRHPDTSDDEAPAAEPLHEVLDAYALLRDPLRRTEYDRAHPVRVARPELRRHQDLSTAAEPYLTAGPVRRVAYVRYLYWSW